jgi:hypothetical protein
MDRSWTRRPYRVAVPRLASTGASRRASSRAAPGPGGVASGRLWHERLRAQGPPLGAPLVAQKDCVDHLAEHVCDRRAQGSGRRPTASRRSRSRDACRAARTTCGARRRVVNGMTPPRRNEQPLRRTGRASRVHPRRTLPLDQDLGTVIVPPASPVTPDGAVPFCGGVSDPLNRGVGHPDGPKGGSLTPPFPLAPR